MRKACRVRGIRIHRDETGTLAAKPMSLKIALFTLLGTMAANAQSVLLAEQYSGADAGEKIARCIAALPATGGVCDARNLAGEQSAQSGFTVGTRLNPVQ